MNTTRQTDYRTRMFARVLGPFLVVTDAAALLRTPDMRTVLSDFTSSSLWAWVAGAFVLLAGLIVVALHQIWNGMAAIIVSALGWLVVARGVILLAFPGTFISIATHMMDAGAWWKAICVVFILLGLYLAYVGWMPDAGRPGSHATTVRNLPRAA